MQNSCVSPVFVALVFSGHGYGQVTQEKASPSLCKLLLFPLFSVLSGPFQVYSQEF